MHTPLPHTDDFHLAQECLEGKTSALAYLQQEYREPLLAYLQGKGALPQEACEIVDELWSDCIASQTRKHPKLAHYNGNSALKTFLHTIALNTAVTRRRRKIVESGILTGEIAPETLESENDSEVGPSHPNKSAEIPLLDLMREAIETAFKACPAKDFVLLQLTHLDGLRVTELARMFGCGIATISRDVQRASREIESATLRHIKATDPWLELKWEDFIELCGVASPACFGVE